MIEFRILPDDNPDLQQSPLLRVALHRHVWLYNQQLPQSALGSKPPVQAMKEWHKLKTKLFKKQPYYLQVCDTQDLCTATSLLNNPLHSYPSGLTALPA